MSADIARFRMAYGRALHAHLIDETETSLRAAYELGRDAVINGLGILDVAHTHHESLLAELAHARPPNDPRQITRAAASFLLEALSTFEMVRRGFTEAREAVTHERRQAAMLRQLSSLLADASLALQAGSSIKEALQLVAEQACELTHGAWSVAWLEPVGEASSSGAQAGRAPANLDQIARDAIAAIAANRESTDVVDFTTRGGESASVAVPLTALDGRVIGVLAIGARARRPITELDKAALLHIGQMAAAGIERASRYRR
jgi:GAF domain-containing protein